MSLFASCSGRWRLLAWLDLTALAVFTAGRAVLVLHAGAEADLEVTALLRIFGTGLVYDAAWIAFATVPLVLLLWLLPARGWAGWPGRLASHAALLGTFYLLGFVTLAEWLFWDEFHARFNFIAVDYLVYTHEVLDNIRESYPVGWLLAALGLLAWAAWWPLRHRHAAWAAADAGTHPGRRSAAALLLLALPVAAGLGLDQAPRRAFANVLQGELASNGPYQFFAAFRNNELDYARFYPTLPVTEADRRLRERLTEPHARFVSGQPFDIEREVAGYRPERRLNVLLVTVESLSASFLARFGETRALTPFLDGLRAESLFFERFYATGTRTVRGLEAVTLSMPPTPGRSIVKRIGRESGHWSLGRVLREHGYAARFLYGGRGYFDNMNAFFRGNGYAITDQSSVPDTEIGFANAWGMSDEDLYRQVLAEADRAAAAGMPFFFHVMTTSNHRPYTFPEGRIDIPSGSGRKGAVKYTDYALGQLFAAARSRPWFDDTLFVILADHTHGAAGREALPLQRYHIPLWIYAPRHVVPGIVTQPASQVDLAPTLLGLLGIAYRSKAYGRDLLAAQARDPRVPIANYEHLGLYRPGSLAVLSPLRRAAVEELQGFVVTGRRAATAADPLVADDIALYQGASHAFHHRLNAWRSPQQVALGSGPVPGE